MNEKNYNQLQTIDYFPNANSSIEGGARELLARRRPRDTANTASMCVVDTLNTPPLIVVRFSLRNTSVSEL